VEHNSAETCAARPDLVHQCGLTRSPIGLSTRPLDRLKQRLQTAHRRMLGAHRPHARCLLNLRGRCFTSNAAAIGSAETVVHGSPADIDPTISRRIPENGQARPAAIACGLPGDPKMAIYVIDTAWQMPRWPSCADSSRECCQRRPRLRCPAPAPNDPGTEAQAAWDAGGNRSRTSRLSAKSNATGRQASAEAAAALTALQCDQGYRPMKGSSPVSVEGSN
jgi:hypothetical protein